METKQDRSIAHAEQRREAAKAKYDQAVLEAHKMHQVRRDAIKDADKEQYDKASGDIEKQYEINQYYNQKRDQADQELADQREDARREY